MLIIELGIVGVQKSEVTEGQEDVGGSGPTAGSTRRKMKVKIKMTECMK